MKTKHDWKFGVRDYNNTYTKHRANLLKYKAACEDENTSKFEWDEDPENHIEDVINSQRYRCDGKYSPFMSKRSIRTAVNNNFIYDIQWYLEQNDLNKHWVTAVYLDCYDKLNKFMNKVANLVLEEIQTV